LALAASLTGQRRERGADVLAAIARYFIAIPVLFFSFEQFMHGNHVPIIPLEPMTPEYVELVVYAPIAVVEHSSLDKGLNLWADALMFCGAVLLLAGAMPREAQRIIG
jgi:hypothetical protein